MKCITVCQPWAQLLVLGKKRFETRDWAAKHRGALAIHSSKTFTPSAKALCDLEPFKSALAPWSWQTLPTGVILGIVDLEEIHMVETMDERDATEEAFGDFRPGRLAWHCINPLMFKTPIPHTGRQGIFELPDQVIHEMERTILVGGTHAAF